MAVRAQVMLNITFVDHAVDAFESSREYGQRVVDHIHALLVGNDKEATLDLEFGPNAIDLIANARIIAIYPDD